MIASNAKAHQRLKSGSVSPSESGVVSLASLKRSWLNVRACIAPTLRILSAESGMFLLRISKSWLAGWRFLSHPCSLNTTLTNKTSQTFWARLLFFGQEYFLVTFWAKPPVQASAFHLKSVAGRTRGLQVIKQKGRIQMKESRACD